MPPSNRPHRRSTHSGRSTMPAGFVRDQLANDPNWQHYTSDERWVCPYCLKDLRAPRSGKSALISHIESHLSNRCAHYNNGEGQIQSDQAIYERKLGLYIEEQARTNQAWQVFDHEGYWYSPSSLTRIPSVRIVNGKFDSFTVNQMVTHLKSCPHFAQGTIHNAETVQQARDQGIRVGSLANNLQRVVTQSVWQYYGNDGWICPYCTSSVPAVYQGMNPGDMLYQMASHLLNGCSVYPHDQRAIKNDGQMQQVLALQQQAAAQAAMPTQQAPAALPIEEIPAALPVAQAAPNNIPLATPVENTPSGELPAPQALQRTNSGNIPIAKPSTQTGIPAAQPVSEQHTSNAFNATPVTQHSMNTITEKSDRHSTTGGYSKISEDLDGIIDGFDKSDDDLPGSAGDADWVTGSTSKQSPTISSPNNPSEPGDALEAHDTSSASSIVEAEDNPEDAFGWMDDSDEQAIIPSQNNEANTDLIRAQGVQINLMNDCPQIPGYTFGTRYEACSSISGDFYEFLEREDGKVIFAQGDVSGHGVEAGLIMSMARKCLTIFARQGGPPGEVVSNLNDALVDDLKGEKFITMCYGELDPEQRTITWVRSGHNPVLRYNIHTKEFSEIKPGGMVVGMKGGNLFRQLLQEETTTVQSGDVFLIYTDGFNETMNRQEEEYGFERMQHVITDKAALGVEELLDHLMNSVRQFRGTTKADDDMTLLALAID